MQLIVKSDVIFEGFYQKLWCLTGIYQFFICYTRSGRSKFKFKGHTLQKIPLYDRNTHLHILFFLSLQDCLRECQEQIEQALSTNLPQAQTDTNSQSSVKCDSNNTEQPTTPTDVRQIEEYS